MTDDSYHMPICIGIDIGISIGKRYRKYRKKVVSVHLYYIQQIYNPCP